jgi:ATP-dependent Lon protease
VLAAHRAGLTEVVLPERNGPDLEDVPAEVRDAMTFHLAATISDVLTPALSAAGAAEGAAEDELSTAA